MENRNELFDQPDDTQGIRGSVLEIRAQVYLYTDSIPQPLV